MEARLLFSKEEAYLAAGVQGADLPTEIPKPSPPVLLAPQEQLGVLSWCASLPQGCRQQHWGLSHILNPLLPQAITQLILAFPQVSPIPQLKP